MPLVSIVMPCYNAGKYLAVSLQSVREQVFIDWELIVVNDGSTDNSESVARAIAGEDYRIQVVSKENGGYISARLHGYRYISPDSKYVIFYDADDKLHPEMLQSLVSVLNNNPGVGAVYCNHVTMDENDRVQETGVYMPRLVPSRWWIRALDESVAVTPFISIFCWTKMIEPMTLLRRSAYEQTIGWDPDFGKGQGNVGDGVYLFSEIALNWQVYYVSRPLYYYRRHPRQSTAVDNNKMGMQAEKIMRKWENRLQQPNAYNGKIKLAILFFRYRVSVYRRFGALKHQLRYYPVRAIGSLATMIWEYLRSLPVSFSYKKLLS